MAFLLTTIAAYGDDWPDYWEDLMDNGAKLTDGWSDAYQVDFTQGGGKGDRPIVLSYDSSPAFTVADDGDVDHQRAARHLLPPGRVRRRARRRREPGRRRGAGRLPAHPEVQAALPESMYVFPVDAAVELPADWARVRAPADRPVRRSTRPRSPRTATTWLREWSDVTSR